MQKRTQELRHFLNSQAFADGFRTTFTILLPALAFMYLGQFEAGLFVSLGALYVNFADAPGPFIHKRNGMLFCSFFVFLATFITIYASLNVYTMGLEVVLVCFFFSMFNVYGNRATSVGNAAILAMILIMDKSVPPSDALTTSLLVLAGGLWYLTVSLLFYTIRPYRIPQRALGECIREIATYLSVKADFYNTKTDLDTDYKRLVDQQIVVNDKQNAVREILFKTRQIVKESTTIGRKLVLTFIDTVDLFEDITATYYDYTSLRQRFEHTGILEQISSLLKEMATELDKMGIAIQANEGYKSNINFETELKQLKDQIDQYSKTETSSSLVLKKILVNLRKLLQRFNDVKDYFTRNENRNEQVLDHSRFISHQSLDPKIFWNNLSFHSSIFKHALRVSLACIAGFIIAKLISYGHHSYWILMTIAFMLKPAFSLTKQRNIHRVIGTIAGGIAGILILIFIHDKSILFAFMILFMLGTYTFQRTNYLAMVICTTPYILILFAFLGGGFLSVAEERLMDTGIGCTIAFAAGYFLFPHWESRELEKYMQHMLEANINYLHKILDGLYGGEISILDYKLARKDVYVSSANLSAAFQRMLSEPKSKQIESSKVHQFVVLNHILFSNIATVATTLLQKEVKPYPQELILVTKKAIAVLRKGLKKFNDEGEAEYTNIEMKNPNRQTVSMTADPDNPLLLEQLEFIYKVSVDTAKTLEQVITV